MKSYKQLYEESMDANSETEIMCNHQRQRAEVAEARLEALQRVCDMQQQMIEMLQSQGRPSEPAVVAQVGTDGYPRFAPGELDRYQAGVERDARV